MTPQKPISSQLIPSQPLTPELLTKQWPLFSKKISEFLTELTLNELNLNCDHVALRVNSVYEAKLLTEYFAKQGEIISNKIINGRPILIISLSKSYQLNGLNIDCVELPYPSDKHYPEAGWEHIELVLPCNLTQCNEFREYLFKRLPKLKQILHNNSSISVKLSSPKGEQEQLTNPTIAFKKEGLCIKVHPHGIKAVIASETDNN